MDSRRFDSIARGFANRKLSRRVALRGSGAGIVGTVLGLAVSGIKSTKAQDATPVAANASSDYRPLAGDQDELLFVQTFGSGTLAPKEGAADEYVLTLAEGSGLTLYMSDRPNRAVGSVTNAQFIDMLGYTPADPPNAALVTQGDAGDQVLVVELLDAVYDETAGTMTYDVQILSEADVDMQFRGTYREQPTAVETYGQNSLFIDDFICGDHEVDCFLNADDSDVGNLGKFGFAWCFGAGSMSCCPSEGCATVNTKCNDAFPEACQGGCYAAAPYFVRRFGAHDKLYSCYGGPS